jgi:hypothetical protein
MATRGKVTIEITDREWDAVLATYAYYSEAHTGESQIDADYLRDMAALRRIKAKWWAAKGLANQNRWR